jgi:vancomycin permeability regulator SanA
VELRVLALIVRGVALAAVLYLAAGGLIATLGLREQPGRADVGIVLGAELERDGVPSSRLAARLDRAIDVWRSGLVPVLIVSGGWDRSGGNEAPAMKRYLVAHGVPDSCVVEDPGGQNTWLTARNAALWMRAHGARRALVVSQYFHLMRCRLAFARHGMPRIFTACPRFFEPRDLYATAREVPALVKYAFRSDK